MEIHLDLPEGDELDALIKCAYALAVAQFGAEPPYEEVRRIFIDLLFGDAHGNVRGARNGETRRNG